MGSEYKKASLRELGVDLIDCDHKTPKAVEKGIPYIGIPQMDNGRINFNANPRLISEDDFVKWTRKANPTYGDVILSRRCNSGETVYVPKHQRFALGQNLVLLRPKGERIFPEYLRYVVKSKEWWDEVAKYLNPGAIFESLKCADIPKFMISEPPIESQKKIVEILSSIENRIELNHQTNQTLEKMAQALFKSWFVDFDPVIDNALAAGNPIPDELQERAELRQRVIAERTTNPKLKPLPDNIQQLFPSEFEESELGWIPKGWEITSFESLISLIGGGTPKTTIDDYWGGDIPWFSVVDAPNDSDVFVIDTEKHVTQLGVDKSSTKILREGTTIISARGTVGKCALVGSLMAMNQSCYGIVGKFENHDEYIYFLTRYQVSDLQKRGHGSVFNTITRETFKSISLAKSSDLLTQKFSEMVRPYLTKILSNNKQNIELTKLRDVLLPKLISGELII
jgi:type I restriction enzyme S subunit